MNLLLRLEGLLTLYLIFGAFIWAQVMLKVPEALLRPLLQKIIIKSTIWYRSMEEWWCLRLIVLWTSWVHNILHQRFNMKNLFAGWVPPLHTVAKQTVLMKHSKDGISSSFSSPKLFFYYANARAQSSAVVAIFRGGRIPTRMLLPKTNAILVVLNQSYFWKWRTNSSRVRRNM